MPKRGGRITSLDQLATPPNAAQSAVALLCCKGTLLALIQFAAHQEPQLPFY